MSFITGTILIIYIQGVMGLDDTVVLSLDEKIESMKDNIEHDIDVLNSEVKKLDDIVERLKNVRQHTTESTRTTPLPFVTKSSEFSNENQSTLRYLFKEVNRSTELLKLEFQEGKIQCLDMRNLLQPLLQNTSQPELEETIASLGVLQERVEAIDEDQENITGTFSLVASERGNLDIKVTDLVQNNKKLLTSLETFENSTMTVLENALDSVSDTVEASAKELSHFKSPDEITVDLSRHLVKSIGPYMKWLYKDSVVKGPRSSCSADKDCLIENSECRYNICACLPGRSFDPSLWDCVSEHCSEYGDTFQEARGYFISGNNKRILRDVGERECRQSCLEERSFVCRTIDYFRNERECYLQTVTKNEVPPRKWKPYLGVIHLQRDCL